MFDDLGRVIGCFAAMLVMICFAAGTLVGCVVSGIFQ